MRRITLEQLNEKLNGRLWEKGDLKRIYLNEGYNTKKVRTTTYVFKDYLGDFVVVCKVDCPTQDPAWEKFEEEMVKEDVYERISSFVNEIKDTLPEVKLEKHGSLEKMAELEPLPIEENPHYVPYRTPVTHVCNLADTPFIAYYRGCGKGVAYINSDGKVQAFQYGNDEYLDMPKKCSRVAVEMSCTQICFTYNNIK